MRYIRIIKQLLTLLSQELFGFISPSVDLSDYITKCEDLIENPDVSEARWYEAELSQHIGGGEVITFASGRMAFYSLLKCWGIGEGDEVALTGFTCSVMVNAVLRVGAKPIYVDIDPNTLGMSPVSLRQKINDKIKVVVAQHTFGIPCEIDTIREITHTMGAKLIEDCALTLGSSYKNVKMGNWGDAAIFSTDHTKPLNTLVGGFAYTNIKDLALQLRSLQSESGELTKGHQYSILNRYIKEHELEQKSHNLFVLNNYWNVLCGKLHLSHSMTPYLQYEASTKTDNNDLYPYPAKLPSSLAYIGRKSLKIYFMSIDKRKRRLIDYLSIENEEIIPKAYYYQDNDIVPLRFAFISNAREKYTYIDDWVWFKRPIVASSEPLENFGYNKGMCPRAEEIGDRIMNFPILINEKKHLKLIKKIKQQK